MDSIRNIRFVPVDDQGYKNFVAGFIRRKQQRRQALSQPPVKVDNPIQDAAYTVECIVRNMVGRSELERVLRYESFNGWRWTRQYAECDYVRHSSKGLIISEIKSTKSHYGLKRGCQQLLRICQLFEAVGCFEPIFLRLDLVNYSDYAIYSEKRRYFDDICIRVVSHPISEVLAFANENGIEYDGQVIERARQKVNGDLIDSLQEQ